MPSQGEQAAEVLAFWFVQSRPRQWFAKDAAFDALLRERFQGLTRWAIAGELDAWGTEVVGGLAGATPPWPSRAIPGPGAEPEGYGVWLAGDRNRARRGGSSD